MIGRMVSHYRVEARLGAGGMGEVYRAQDLALGRTVALKVLAAGVDPALRSRLLREAAASARLQHPGIATFYEAGQAEGTAFIAMELVPGRTLRQRLREGPLPRDAALALAAGLLEALAHAHAAGILHRDIKPENVMLTGERTAKLLDFGLAKHVAVDEATPQLDTATALTGAGMVVGTVGYMAPEQVSGGDVDARADLFSLGAVLYELLAGRPAFPGATPTERLAALLTKDPAPLQGPGVSPGLWPVLARALERDPARRYATARALLADLHRVGSGQIVSPLPDTLAILDLQNLSGDPADNWMGSGIAESLAIDLARVPGLSLVGRDKVARARTASDADLDVSDLGLRLGCRWVLSGGYQRVGPSLRVTVRLTEAATGRVALAEKIDATVDRIFEIQDRLAAACTAALDLTAPSDVSRPAPMLNAYEAYARGRRFWMRMEKGSFEDARELYEQAIAVDPGYAPALAGLAAVHALRFTFTTDPKELDAASDYARRAIRADARLGEPHIWLGYVLMRQGRPDEALAEERHAMLLEPANHFGPYFAACALLVAEQPGQALPLYQQAIAVDPHAGFDWLGLGFTHLWLGSLDEARYAFVRTVALEQAGAPGSTVGAAGYLGECLRRAGQLAEARESCLAGLESVERSDHMYRDTLRAYCLCALGRTALDQGDPPAARTAFSQAVSHLRGRPRALGGGHLMVQALAGLARTGEIAALEEALRLDQARAGHDFSWFYGCSDAETRAELAAARPQDP